MFKDMDDILKMNVILLVFYYSKSIKIVNR